MKKLTDEEIKQIRKLAEKGEYKIAEIAQMFDVTSSTITYWTNDKYRERHKNRVKQRQHKKYVKGETWSQKNPEEYREYQREYHRQYREEKENENNR